ncbi:hypothetical protein QCA50_001520 [Cerrena zonata]|uniref:F-box domain-containing protein n=1 Tax=Cerrena zonata TaxID=2478898 RepID=A0AAW0GQZ5_9APHY
MKFEDLPSDIVDRILMSIPDFTTLSAALLTSKAHVYNVYQAHPKSVFHAVAYNITGPAIRQALCVAKMAEEAEALYDEESDDSDEQATVIVELLSDDEQVIEKLLSDKNVTSVLRKNAKIVNKLEDLFSRRNKDRTSTKTALTEAESKRFHRGIYRLWALVLFQEHNYGDTLEEKITDYLENLSLSEILEIDRVRDFFDDTRLWLNLACHDSPTEPSQFIPCPNGLLSAIEELDIIRFIEEYSINPPQKVFNSLSKTLITRHQLDDKKRAEQRAKAIIDNVEGPNDICHRCNAVKGLQLWGPTNWDLLRGHLELKNVFLGYLRTNPIERAAFRQYVFDNYHPLRGVGHQFSDFIEQCFDTDAENTENWDKTKWHCLDCVHIFLKQRAWKWWYQQKQEQPGYQAVDDCWYGYNCRTQTHKWAHAQKLNHLCVPTRGDPHPDEQAAA